MKRLTENYKAMSWVLLEYELIYFCRPQVKNNIDADWLNLRTISDNIYDNKLLVFQEIAKKLKMNKDRPIGCDLYRPAVQLILRKMKKSPFSNESVPTSWPDTNTETDEELNYRCFHSLFRNNLTKVQKKQIILDEES